MSDILEIKSCTSYLQKQEELKKLFLSCPSKEARYYKIIELGKTLENLPPLYKTEENIVAGCQSIVYLHSIFFDNRMRFFASSDALISAGLAALLIKIYDHESPETVLKCPPLFIDEIGLIASLSPSRSNGFASIYLRMKQEALNCLVKTN